MVALLEPVEQAVEESTQERAQSSGIEREILDLLRRPARSPPGIKDLKRELLHLYTLLQIQRALLDVLDKGLIETVYTRSFELGFRLASPDR